MAGNSMEDPSEARRARLQQTYGGTVSLLAYEEDWFRANPANEFIHNLWPMWVTVEELKDQMRACETPTTQ